MAFTGDIILKGQAVIEEFLNLIKGELLNYLQSEGRNATGKSASSLQLANLSNNTGQLVGHKGIEYVFRGRGPGGLPPIAALVDWCNARGIPRGAAFGIAKLIAAAGTKLWREGRNVLNEVITEEKVEKLKQSILVTFKAEISSNIQSIIAAA